MKLFEYAYSKLSGVSKAILRFWAVFVCLAAVAVLNTIAIETSSDFVDIITSLIFGAFCFLCSQSLSERFGRAAIHRLLFYMAALLAGGAYYLYIRSVGSTSELVLTKTAIGIFALFIAFIWVPSIRNAEDFSSVFLSVFKAFFTSVFFSGVIYGGIVAIIGAMDALLFDINETAFVHALNVVGVIWAPMLLLSLIPVFAGRREDTEKIKKSIGVPKFLEVLLSYVLVPLISIYTLILLVYIIKTVSLGNWNNNRLEPLTLSYLITVLLLYILEKRLENIFAVFFRRVFPVLLVAIALFQIIASAVTISAEGIVHSRYLLIIFSLYCIICGVLLRAYPNRKNDYIAWLAIVFSLISVAPFVGAFSVSAASQSAIVVNALKKNDMLISGSVVPKTDISNDDKWKISGGVEYLSRIGELDRLIFLPDNLELHSQFENVFGFTFSWALGGHENSPDTFKVFQLDTAKRIDIGGYDHLLAAEYSSPGEQGTGGIIFSDTVYSVILRNHDGGDTIVFSRGNAELMEISLEDMFGTFAGYSIDKAMLEPEAMRFNYENGTVKASIIFQSAEIFHDGSSETKNARFYILYSIKQSE